MIKKQRPADFNLNAIKAKIDGQLEKTVLKLFKPSLLKCKDTNLLLNIKN